ncbi:MAG TPA: methionine--tRNA ligase, partial [Spirochaetia bacterium]|nr:methionine--tRNA ligase [Spirochaetia bacterium]
MGKNPLLFTRFLVNNLKPAKLRGVESRGMLLAASKDGPEGREVVEVLDVPWAAPGARVFLETGAGEPPAEIDIDTFFSIPIRSEGGTVKVGTKTLQAEGRALSTVRVADGNVG